MCAVRAHNAHADMSVREMSVRTDGKYTWVFPDSLKVAKVVPLYKKKCKQNIDNYRPVAILSVFSKLLEKVMYSRLFSFFEKYENFN